MKRPGRTNTSKALIVNALLQRMKSSPYEEINISEICAAATVSRNTFYRNFENKDSVLEYLLLEKCRYIIRQFELNETYDPMNPTNQDLLRSYTRFYTYWLEEKELIQLILSHNLRNQLQSAMTLAAVNSYSEKWVQSLQGPFSNFPTYYYNWLASSLFSILMSWAENGFDLPPKTVAEFLVCISSSITEK